MLESESPQALGESPSGAPKHPGRETCGAVASGMGGVFQAVSIMGEVSRW